MRPLIGYSAPAGGLDLPCGLSVITGRSTWFSVPAAPVRWTAPLDTSLGPEIMVAAPSDARPGDTQTLRTRVRYGDKTDVFRVRATVVAPQRRGDRIGWISGEADPLRLAAEALGVEPIVLTDARRDDLSRYATLILGSEALNKNFCNVAEAVDRVGAWVIAGGRLIVGQLNDGGWDVAMLPFDLGLSDAETTSGGIVRPGHPLFTSPNRIADLSGVVSYDTITAVSGDWDVLLASASGGPSIIEGRAGEGRVLVVMPSFDRPVAGVDTPDMVRLPACRALIENLLHYAGYPATTPAPPADPGATAVAEQRPTTDAIYMPYIGQGAETSAEAPSPDAASPELPTATPAKPIISFSATPDRVERPGDCVTLRWRVVNKGAESLRVHVHAVGDKGLSIDHRVSFDVAPGETAERSAPVKVATDASGRRDDGTAPAVRSALPSAFRSLSSVRSPAASLARPLRSSIFPLMAKSLSLV